MSKDYRYQREWDSVEDDDFDRKNSSKRHLVMKQKQKRDHQRRDKQRRAHFDEM